MYRLITYFSSWLYWYTSNILRTSVFDSLHHHRRDHICDEPDTSDYSSNGEWRLLSTGCYKHYLKYDCCVGEYCNGAF